MLELITFRSDWAFWPLADQSEAPRHLAGAHASCGRADGAVAARQEIRAELAARHAMQTLASLDDRMLRDIGIERGQIWHASRHGREAMAASADLRADFTRWI